MFQVTVADHYGRRTTKLLPSETSIHKLKKEKLWNGGQEEYSPDLFTLSHEEKMLNDDMTLDDLCMEGKELFLEIHSFVIILQHYTPRTFSQERCTLKMADFRDPLDMKEPVNVIAAYLYSTYEDDPFKVKLYTGNSTAKTQLSLEDCQSLMPGQKIIWDNE